MEIMQVSPANLAQHHREKKSDFSVSSLIGLNERSNREHTKRTSSSDDIDSIGSSVGSESGESGHSIQSPNLISPVNTNENNRSPPRTGSSVFPSHIDVHHGDDEDDNDDASSGDSGLLKDINENVNRGNTDKDLTENKPETDYRHSSSGKEMMRPYLNPDKYDLERTMKPSSEQQSDLSALQKLYSLESLQRFGESSAVFPGREYSALPNFDKPLMIDVGPGRSFSNPNIRLPSTAENSNREGEKIKKKTVVREAVDPAKYVRVQDLEGIKFACSKCGNIYKWRKSLNKHWKEKHDGEIPTPHGQNLPMLNIPQVKGKTTNINTALFSYAPLGAPARQTSSDYPASSMPTMPSKVKTGQQYPSADMLSKYEALSKHWMNFAQAAVAKTPAFPERMEDIKPERPKSSDSSNNLETMKKPGPDQNASLRKSEHEVAPSSIHSSLEMSYAAAAAAAAVSNPFFLVAPPPAHSQGYHRPVPEHCDDSAPLDLSKPSKTSSSSSNPLVADLPPRDSKHSDKILDFSGGNPAGLHAIPDADRFYQNPSYSDALGAFKCAVCKHTFKTIIDLNQHYAIFHIDVIYEKTFSNSCDNGMKDGTFSCIICSSTYLLRSEIIQHFEKNHCTLPNPYKKRASPGTLVGDYMTEPLSKKSKETLQCIQCGFLARDLGELSRHQLVHSLNRPYACTRCGYSTKHQDELNKHMSKYHSLDETSDLHATSRMSPGTEVLTDDPQEINISADSDSFSYQSSITSHHDKTNMECDSPKVINVSPDSGFNTPSNSGSKRPASSFRRTGSGSGGGITNNAEILLPYKCSVCEYRARWPSEITQHMKNHSDEKPFHCPRCTYKSKWKWDVVKHLKRCGGGTVKDVIDTTKQVSNKMSSPSWVKALQFKESSLPSPGPANCKLSSGPPNVTVLPSGVVKPSNPAPSSGGEGHLSQSPPSPLNPDHPISYSLMDQHPSSSTSPGFKAFSSLNQGQYHCLHCPFVGNSPAELKRHTRVHSDEKPYSCHTCGYSSKWKCDLKKHIRTYNHESSVNLDSKLDSSDQMNGDENLESPTDSHKSIMGYDDIDVETINYSTEASSPSKQLYKCDSCQYVTYKKNFLESHMKIHSQPGQQKTSSANKLKCKQCDFEAEDLPSFLKHKLTHGSSSNITGSTFSSAENRTEDKAAKEQISPGSSHAEEIDVTASPTKHRRKPIKQFRCSKCPYTCFKRSGLEQHQSMHEPRGPGSLTCPYCDYNVYSRSLLGQHIRLHPEHVQQAEECSDEDVDVLEPEAGLNLTSTPTTIPPPSATSMAVFPGQMEEERTYTCEWCDFTSTQLNGLYEHAKKQHPAEYDQQETAYNSMDSSTDDNFLLSPPISNSSLGAAELADDLKDESRKMKTNGMKRKRKMLTCTDCGYQTDNSANLARHAIKHGQNARYECKYCNYSLNRQGLVIAHMKQVHGVTVKALAKREDSAMEKVTDMNTDSNRKIATTTDDESDPETVSIKGEMLIVKQVDNKRHYQCPKCAYSSANSSHCVNHLRQHGSNKRYNCEYCDYSLDKLPHIIQHMKQVHDHNNGDPIVNKQIISNEPTLPKSALFKRNKTKSHTSSRKLVRNALSKVFRAKKQRVDIKNNCRLKISGGKRMHCSICPYHTCTSGLLQSHLLQHNMAHLS